MPYCMHENFDGCTSIRNFWRKVRPGPTRTDGSSLPLTPIPQGKYPGTVSVNFRRELLAESLVEACGLHCTASTAL
eukprot:410825-Rhodomonas_salina.1